MFYIQSMIVKTYPKAKAIKEIACYRYSCGLLFITNTIIAIIVVLFDFMQFYHYFAYKYWFM